MILQKEEIRRYLPLGLPILLVVGMFVFVKTEIFASNQVALSNALLFDLLIGIPLLYLLTIRKTSIPTKSVVKVFTLCLFISTLIIPESSILLIQVIKQVIYPLIKLWICLSIARKCRQIVKEYRNQSKHQAGITLYSTIINKVFPGKFGEIIKMEFSLLYFLFKGKRSTLFAENEFSYSSNKGTIELISAFAGIVVIETIVAHILISKWSLLVAFVSSYGSLYLILLLTSILRSRNHFPISIQEQKLYLRSGYVNKSVVQITDISRVEYSSRSNIPDLMKLSAFKGIENHNVILYFSKRQKITKVFGVEKEYYSIGLFVDEPKRFINSLEVQIKQIKDKH